MNGLHCVIWVSGDLGSKLAQHLESRFTCRALAVTAPADAEAALRHGPDVFIGAANNPDVRAAAALWAGVRHRALLVGSRDPHTPEYQEWARRGVAILAGDLPRPVDEWAAGLAAASEPVLGWAPGETAPDLAWDPQASPRRAGRGLILAVSSTAGGVGKTTTASILARLAAEAGQHVVLVEADEDKSGLLRLFGRDPADQGLDTIPRILWDDPDRLFPEVEARGVSLNLRPGSVTIYPMVGQVEGLVLKRPEPWMALIEHLAQAADLVICDLPPRLRDALAYGPVRIADQTLLLYEPTEVNLDAYIKHVAMAKSDELDLDPRRFRLVLNRWSNAGLPPEKFERCVPDVPLIGVIPEDLEGHRKYVNTGSITLTGDSPWRDLYARVVSARDPEPERAPGRPPQPAAHLVQAPPRRPDRPADHRPLFKKILGLKG